MLVEDQFDWIRIADITQFSIFESVSFLLIQTLYGLPEKTFIPKRELLPLKEKVLMISRHF